MERADAEKTVLFADVAGSTRLYHEIGDEAGRRLLMDCLEMLAEAVESAGGEVVERIGDELMCTFLQPDSAAAAATAMHTRLSLAHVTRRIPHRVRIRVGFTQGPVVETGEGLFGATLHTASRLASLAKAGQTLTTKATLEQLRPDQRRTSRYVDSVTLKGEKCEQEIHELVWSLSATTTRLPLRAVKPDLVGVELRYGGRTYRVDAQAPRVELGRDPACDLRLDGRSVSQLHARIVWDRGKARLEDVSTNGTLIEPRGRTPVRLHRDWTTLSGNGVLRLGLEVDDDAASRVDYVCDYSLGLKDPPETRP